jgi:hypothetical protein
MAEVTLHNLDDIDKALEEALSSPTMIKWDKQFQEERRKEKAKREQAMKEAAELAKGKEAIINVKLKRDIANDLHHTRFVPLTLTEVLVYSGQARIATHKETRELSRT